MEETSHAETRDIDVKPFLDFVDQSLQGFCKQQESIRAFSLHMHFYCHKYDAPFINKWIKLTADNDFQVICIRFENGFNDPPRFILPHTIFTSKLLTILSLVNCELKDYSLRDTARLDSLHDLSLEYIDLSDEIFNQLISFSPNIMHFSLKRCKGIKFLQLLNLCRLENVVIEDGCRFDSTEWIHRIKIEAQSLRTFYFYRGYRKDSQLDLKCCKNLEILSLDAVILPRSFFENIFSDFPPLKSLFLENQCKLEKIEFASPRLELLHLRHVGNLVDAIINTPNLRFFKYTNYDLLPFLFQMNTVRLQKTSFQLWPCTVDVSWFLKLREFIGTQSHNEVLSLKLLHNSKATFDLQELRGITIPPMHV